MLLHEICEFMQYRADLRQTATSNRQARVNKLAELRLQVLADVKMSVACESKKEILRLRK